MANINSHGWGSLEANIFFVFFCLPINPTKFSPEDPPKSDQHNLGNPLKSYTFNIKNPHESLKNKIEHNPAEPFGSQVVKSFKFSSFHVSSFHVFRLSIFQFSSFQMFLSPLECSTRDSTELLLRPMVF